MLTYVFSDFISNRLSKAQEQREAIFEKGMAQYHKAIEIRQERIKSLKIRTKRAWLEFNLVKGFFLSVSLAFVSLFTRSPRKPKPLPITVQEMKLRAGKAGEMVLQNYMGSFLDNSWTLITGIKTRKGELDALLIGPQGLFAFEVKTRKGVVSANGDTWILDKYDRYGNLVERELPICDKTGRSPSRQLNEAVEALYGILPGSLKNTPISRIVVFPHPETRFGSFSNPTVDLVIGPQNYKLLERYIGSRKEGRISIEEIVTALRKT